MNRFHRVLPLLALCQALACHQRRMLRYDSAVDDQYYTAWGLEEGRTRSKMRYHMRWDRESELTPVVLLHGNFDSVDSWRKMVVEMPREVPLVLLELPGFGESRALEASGPEDHAAAIAQALEELELPPVVLAGHSLGGSLAVHVSIHHPERVAHLVMISAGFIDPINRPDLLEQIAYIMELARVWGLPPDIPDDPLAEPVRQLLLDAVVKDERIDHRLVRRYEQNVVDCLGSAARLSGDGWSNPAAPKDIPLTAIYGWQDRWVSVTNATQLGGFGSSEAVERRLFLLKNSGHLPQLDQPGDLATILTALSGVGDLDAIPACLGEGLVHPEDHPRAGHLRRKAFGGEFPVSCVGEGPPAVSDMDCVQLLQACTELQEPACARLIEQQKAEACTVRACEPITTLSAGDKTRIYCASRSATICPPCLRRRPRRMKIRLRPSSLRRTRIWMRLPPLVTIRPAASRRPVLSPAVYENACMNEVSGEVCWKMGTAKLYGLCGDGYQGTSDTILYFEDGCDLGHQPSCEALETVEDILKQRKAHPPQHRGGLL